jgi:hypothetical protein
MSGETSIAKELVANAMAAAEQDPKQDKDAMGRALIVAVLGEFAKYRPARDISAQLQYLADNLEEEHFVITRGC